MINNFKKLALQMIMINIAVVPIVLVSSCNTSTSKINYEISSKNDPQLIRADINSEGYKTLTILNKLFDGLTSENLPYFNVSLKPINAKGDYVITLIAKNGYTINEKETLDSNIFNIVNNLVIGIINTSPTDIKPSDLEQEKYKDFALLSKLFNGIDFEEKYLPNLEIEKIIAPEKDTYQIELIPITGVTINDSPEAIISVKFTLLIDNLIKTRNYYADKHNIIIDWKSNYSKQ
ncbi:MAG: hypothetical protein ACRC63_00780 [Metamycoplasmataceae bacterium]